MKTTTDTIEATYESMISECKNSRLKTSLKRLKSACDYLSKNGIKCSPSNVEKYCFDRQWDGPKAQSIRNSKDVLNKYVSLCQSAQITSSEDRPAPNEPIIADESLRAYVQLLKQERDMALAEKKRIEKGLRSIPAIDVDKLISMDSQTTPSTAHPKAKSVTDALTSEAVNALRNLFDTQKLDECNLEIFKSRLRHKITKNVLIEKDDMEILSKFMSLGHNPV